MSVRGPARAVARQAVRRLAYWFIAASGAVWRLWRRRAKPDTVRRILVIRLDLLGDVLFTRPLTRALRERYPEAAITGLTLPYTAPLMRLSSEVDEVVAVDTNRIRTLRGLLNPRTWREYVEIARYLRSQRFDLAVSVCGRMGSLCAFLSGAGWTIGYEAEAYPFLLDRKVPGGRYLTRKHEVEYVGALGEPAGAAAVPARLAVNSPAWAVTSAATKLARAGVTPQDWLTVVHAGAVNGSAKRWPPRSWASFIDRLAASTGTQVVLVGAASDEPIAREVLAAARSPVRSLVGRTTVEELIAVIDRADLVASGDSGPLHLAVALGRPLVAVYGPTDPRVHGPYHPAAPVSIHRADLPCSPCYTMAATAECPLGDPICMRLVTVDAMVRSAVQLLEQATRSAGRKDELLVAQKDALQDAE